MLETSLLKGSTIQTVGILTASLDLNCLKELEAKALKMYGVASSTKESQIKGEKQLEDVTSSVDYITKKFDEYEEERKKEDEQIKMFARVCVFSGKRKR